MMNTGLTSSWYTHEEKLKQKSAQGTRSETDSYAVVLPLIARTNTKELAPLMCKDTSRPWSEVRLNILKATDSPLETLQGPRSFVMFEMLRGGHSATFLRQTEITPASVWGPNFNDSHQECIARDD